MRPIEDFELLRPVTLEEAATLLARDGARLVAGGTDLVPNLRRGLHSPSCLVDLGAVAGLERIEFAQGRWRIGAAATLAALSRHEDLARSLPALAQAASQVAGPGHRSAATVGGNLCQDTRCVFYNQSEWWREANAWCLKRDGEVCHVAPQGKHCHAAFEGDLAPALLAYGAELEIACAAGTHRRPLGQLYRDDGAAHLALGPGEIVAAVLIVAPHAASRSAYRKARVRASMDFPLAGVAVALRLEQQRLAELAVGISGTNSRPILLAGTEALIGQPVDERALQTLSKLTQKQVSPMRSTVTASNYRRLVAATLVQRLVGELAGERAGPGAGPSAG